MRGNFALVLATLLLAPPAWADHASIHATADGEVATTDNLYSVGSGIDHSLSTLFILRPGLLYAYDGLQMLHDLTAEAEVIGNVMNADDSQLMGRAGWKGLFFTGPRSQVGMSINAGRGLLSLLTARTAPEDTVATATPSGRVDVQYLDTSETASWVSGKHTRLNQGVFGRYGYTDNGAGTTTDSREVGASLGIERSFERDTVALEASVSYLQLERIAPMDALLPSREDQQINPRGTVFWRHEFTRQWSTNTDGGVVLVNPVGVNRFDPEAERRSGTYAVFGSQLSYNQPWGRATLAARRNVQPNMYLAQNTVDDGASLSVAMPLPFLRDSSNRTPKLAGRGSFGVARSQLINSETGGLDGNFEVARLDVGVGYSPRPSQTYGVRYEMVYQNGDPNAVGMAIPSYFRNTISFTFALRYPERVAGDVPQRLRKARADRKDMARGSDDLLPELGQSFE